MNNEDLQVNVTEKKFSEETYTPGVIEPSFGIGRIVYCIFEHCFRQRENDKNRTYFSFPKNIAPVKCSILPLLSSKEILGKIKPIRRILIERGISYKIDQSGESIGRRYARTDEIGIPFALTIDNQTIEDDTVTLRELNSLEQIRLPISKISDVLWRLTNNLANFEELKELYPAQGK